MKKVLSMLLVLTLILSGNHLVYAAQNEGSITVGTQEETGSIAWAEAKGYSTSLLDPEFKYFYGKFFTSANYEATPVPYFIGIKCEKDISIKLYSNKDDWSDYAIGFDIITDCDSFEYHIINGDGANYLKSTRVYVKADDILFSDTIFKGFAISFGAPNFTGFQSFSKDDFLSKSVTFSDFDMYADETLTAQVPGLYDLVRPKDSSIIKDSTEHPVDQPVQAQTTISSSIKCNTMIILPKSIDLEGEKSKEFDIQVKGVMSSVIKLVVSADSEIDMTNSTGDETFKATIDLDATFKSDEISENEYTTKKGTITFPVTKLGNYSGVLNFTISVEENN